MKVRNEAQEKAAETDNPDDWRIYRNIRNQVTASCRRDKAVWEREKLDHMSNTASDTWKTVKGWLGWGSAATPTKLFSDGRLVTSPGGLAACMNKFFLDKIKRLRQNIPAANADPLVRLREATSHRNCSFKLKLVSQDHVLKLIKNLRNSSATGVDYRHEDYQASSRHNRTSVDSHNQLIHPHFNLPSHVEVGQGDPLIEVYTARHNPTQELSPSGSATCFFEGV